MQVTNPENRCLICDGREVLHIDTYNEVVISSSLEFKEGAYLCKNYEECKRNVEADKIIGTPIINDEEKFVGFYMKKTGKSTVEVLKL